MGRLFGTDGVRGLANRDVTAELALDLSVAAAHVLGSLGQFEGHRPRAIVGRDSRASGEFLAAAVSAGLASAGVDVNNVGVLPTPAVAFLTAELGVDIGVVLSASHNPMPDNGIKFLARGGVKLDDALEREIEAHVGEPWDRPVGGDVGRVTPYARSIEEYADHLVATLDQPLSAIRVVLDCANGAASDVGPHTLRAAGADVIALNDDPDGLNINERCGSTHLEGLGKAVLARGADVGFALDGDADRCLAVDHTGATVDGDQLMAMLALDLHETGRLAHETVVATVMSNLGFVQAMGRAGITVHQTAVGDRYVLEAMRDGGYNLGGEQSGHIIMTDHATTGDGLMAALQALSAMIKSRKPASEAFRAFEPVPQLMKNVRVGDANAALATDAVTRAIADAEARLGKSGRILVRKSGTEPVIRVMAEGDDSDLVRTCVDRIIEAIPRAKAPA